MCKIRKIMPLVMLVSCVSACTTLGTEDRNLLTSIKSTAEDAKHMSQQALQAARDANEQARRAAESAKIASEKAERIFKQSQKK